MHAGDDGDEESTRLDIDPDPSSEPSKHGVIDPTCSLDDEQTFHRSADPSQDGTIGDLIGRYHILGPLGRGGMGLVLRAHDPELDRELAIKLLRERDDETRTSQGRALLKREARAIARVSHPNVIAVYDVGEHEGRVYVAMELVNGRPLHSWMRRPHSLAELLEVFVQAARGLAAAHGAGLVHRDFKPANVLVGDDGRVRVLDFGLARRPGRRGPRDSAPTRLLHEPVLTAAGTLAGTPAYMSPEQFDATEPDPRSDQFSFSVSLYEALFGVRPFVGDTLPALREAVTQSPLTLPSSAEGLPLELRALLHRGLAKRGRDRFSSMTEVVEALDDIRAALTRAENDLLVPMGFVATGAASSSTLSSSERLSVYLATLPRGLDSHPQCRMHTSAVRLALSRYPLSDQGDLPPGLARALAELAGVDLHTPWLAEALARSLLAAIYDRRVRSRAAWDRFWYEVARARFTRGFLAFAAGLGNLSLGAALPRLWNDHHQGSELGLEIEDDEHLLMSLSSPPHLLDELAHAEAIESIRAGVELIGRGEVVEVEHEAHPRGLRARFTLAQPRE